VSSNLATRDGDTELIASSPDDDECGNITSAHEQDDIAIRVRRSAVQLFYYDNHSKTFVYEWNIITTTSINSWLAALSVPTGRLLSSL